MEAKKPTCFFLIPFSPESHYFYLYLKAHIEAKHRVVCEKASDQVRTVPMWEKIRDMIRRADVIIANCTGENTNVFYELGLAHGFEKKVILLTSDPIELIPSDVRLFEFIKYDHSNEKEFLEKLDGALRDVLEGRYEEHFDEAAGYFSEFAKLCPEATIATKDEFIARYRGAELVGETILPAKLVTFITQNNTDVRVMGKLVIFVPTSKKSPSEVSRE